MNKLNKERKNVFYFIFIVLRIYYYKKKLKYHIN